MRKKSFYTSLIILGVLMILSITRRSLAYGTDFTTAEEIGEGTITESNLSGTTALYYKINCNIGDGLNISLSCNDVLISQVFHQDNLNHKLSDETNYGYGSYFFNITCHQAGYYYIKLLVVAYPFNATLSMRVNKFTIERSNTVPSFSFINVIWSIIFITTPFCLLRLLKSRKKKIFTPYFFS